MSYRPPEVRVIQVVEIAFARGQGNEKDPVRRVTRYLSLENVLLAENDPFPHVRTEGHRCNPDGPCEESA